jgi:hypothetical protein
VGRIEAYPLQRVYLEVGEALEPQDHPDAASFAEAAWEEVRRRVDHLRRQAEDRSPAREWTDSS